MSLLSSFTDDLIEAGCDEAGRGCLAGPVFAASVILPKNFYHPLLNDSKQVSEKNRAVLRPVIEQNALSYAVFMLDNEVIDKINILNASIACMHEAVRRLKIRPELLLIDGNRFKKYEDIPHRCIIKGDSKYASIAAASILAKTYRDEYMIQLHSQISYYAWNENKGYPTAQHREAIVVHGVSAYHRKSFKLIDNQLSIDW